MYKFWAETELSIVGCRFEASNRSHVQEMKYPVRDRRVRLLSCMISITMRRILPSLVALNCIRPGCLLDIPVKFFNRSP
jgi:hypothetical protein